MVDEELFGGGVLYLQGCKYYEMNTEKKNIENRNNNGINKKNNSDLINRTRSYNRLYNSSSNINDNDKKKLVSDKSTSVIKNKNNNHNNKNDKTGNDRTNQETTKSTATTIDKNDIDMKNRKTTKNKINNSNNNNNNNNKNNKRNNKARNIDSKRPASSVINLSHISSIFDD